MYFFLTFGDISSRGSRIKWMNEKRGGRGEEHEDKSGLCVHQVKFCNLIVRLNGRVLLFCIKVIDQNLAFPILTYKIFVTDCFTVSLSAI